MVDGINLNNLSVDKSGRVTFSGIGSGIDYQAAIDGIMAARRIPVDTLEQRITGNAEKIAAYRDLSTLLGGLKDSLSTLYGAVTFDSVNNVFKAKQAFASVTRDDGGTPSAAANLLGVTVTNAAPTGSHSIEVLRMATAEKIGSGAFTSLTDDLGTARGGTAGSVSGSFDINGVTIDVFATDTLQNLRDRINAANTGEAATGVTASIVSVGATEHYLVLTADETGTAITVDAEVGGVLADLGISGDGGTTFLNELQTAQTAQFQADGLLDGSQYQSDLVASDTAQIDSYTSVTAGAHSFEIRDAGGTVLKTVSYSNTDTLQTLAASITDAVAGITATVVDEDGQSRLEILKDDGGAITLAGDTDNLLSALSFDKKPLVIERASNTIDDLFAGVTVDLFQAEPGTTVTLDIEQDLSAVKTAIMGFVDAYNAVKSYINSQDLTDTDAETEGDQPAALLGSRTLADIEATLGRILGNGTTGVSSDFSVLAQVGIDFVDNNALSDPLLKDTLTVDESALDEALLNNPDDVRRLFTFDFSSSNPQVTVLGFTGETAYSSSGYTLSLTDDGTQVTGATFNGVAGSATVDGNTITATDATGANGLKLFYSGNADASGITVDLTAGIGAQLFFAIDGMINTATGSVQAEVDTLTDQNDQTQERVDDMLDRLDYQRDQLTQRFIKMETSLATMNRILDSIKQTVDGWFNDSN